MGGTEVIFPEIIEGKEEEFEKVLNKMIEDGILKAWNWAECGEFWGT
jgi:hypothetical protein